MKARHIVLLSVIAAAILYCAGGLTVYLLSSPDEPTNPVQQTQTENTPKPGIHAETYNACGKIAITGAWDDRSHFLVIAENNVETASTVFTLRAAEPRVRHIFALGLLAGADYYRPREKLYAMYGAEINYLRMSDHIGIGGGGWYKQSVVDNGIYDAGVKIMAALEVMQWK